jgi:hypothetical protein
MIAVYNNHGLTNVIVAPGGPNANEPYVGLLYAMEDMAVYP